MKDDFLYTWMKFRTRMQWLAILTLAFLLPILLFLIWWPLYFIGLVACLYMGYQAGTYWDKAK